MNSRSGLELFCHLVQSRAKVGRGGNGYFLGATWDRYKKQNYQAERCRNESAKCARQIFMPHR
jgi:hypothetical protein